MKYAVIRTGGKQYRVAEGDTIIVERLAQDINEEFVSAEVLLVNDEGKITVGTPLVSGIPVKGTLITHSKGEKIRVSKFKSKVRFRKTTGHRQSLSQVTITSIGNQTKKKSEEEQPTVAKTAKSANKTKEKIA